MTPSDKAPASNRFAKGKSGNPKGRPRKPAEAPALAFEVVLDKVFSLNQDGVRRELTVDEALQHRTFQDAWSIKHIENSKPAL